MQGNGAFSSKVGYFGLGPPKPPYDRAAAAERGRWNNIAKNKAKSTGCSLRRFSFQDDDT